ncbi:hypothetical protein DB346_18740 [Verrucomicrobia bacterium LW23]|nr:hypothetical protein DB346_18740 [Verrucomicrobia bacterium LW23]
MKNLILSTALFLGLAISSMAPALAHEAAKAGPTGGRVLHKGEPHAEFFVNADKKVEIRFLDDKNKVIAPADQKVTVIVGERSNPTTLSFTKDGDKLISDKALPAGEVMPAVVQIKPTADGKAVTEKFNLNLAKCPTCKLQEYACECAH